MRNKQKEAEFWLRIGCGCIHNAAKQLSGAMVRLERARTLRGELANNNLMPLGVADYIDATELEVIGEDTISLIIATGDCMAHALDSILSQDQH